MNMKFNFRLLAALGVRDGSFMPKRIRQRLPRTRPEPLRVFAPRRWRWDMKPRPENR
jgi:hypothetical protein